MGNSFLKCGKRYTKGYSLKNISANSTLQKISGKQLCLKKCPKNFNRLMQKKLMIYSRYAGVLLGLHAVSKI